jgi:glycosyltransferase involved in cell wall biosynthesis
MLSVVVVIPLYNGARWIEHALLSVARQTRSATEIVVVDDGSTDGGAGAEIVRRIADSGTVPPISLLQKPNGGQSSARNYGVAHSKGKLIALLDQDDVWYPHHLARLIAPFEAADALFEGDCGKDRRPLGWTYSDADLIDELGDVTRSCWHRHVPGAGQKQTLTEFIARDMLILPSASLVSRAAFEHVGGFDERLVGYEDDDLFLRLFRAGFQSAYVAEPLIQYRVYPGSSSRTPKMALSEVIYANKLFELFPEFSQVLATRFIRTLRGTYINALKANDAQTLRAAVARAGAILPHTTGVRAAVLHILWLVAQHHRLAWLASSGVGRHVIRSLWKLLFKPI